LAGITRSEIIKIAKSLNFEVIERPIYINEIEKIQECFITSTTAEVLPINSIDNYYFAIGERTIKIYNEFIKRAL